MSSCWRLILSEAWPCLSRIRLWKMRLCQAAMQVSHGFYSTWILCLYSTFNPIQARGHFVSPSPKSQHIFKTAWSLELLLCDFSFHVFPIKKFCSTSHPSCMLPWQPFNFLVDFRKPESPLFFQVFLPERNFLWDSLLCFGHPKTLRSLIMANIRTVTMETIPEIILPKYGHQHQH